MIFMKANTRRAVALSDDLITTNSAGIEVSIRCSEAWEGLTRIAIFRGSDTSVDVLLTGDSCTVPPEVLTRSGGQLLIGLYGTDGSGSLVIPTVWADAGRILPGAVPSGVEPSPETQPLIDQLLAAAQLAQEIAQSVRDDADNGEFDGEDGNCIWWTNGLITDVSMAGQVYGQILRSRLNGRSGTPAVHDLVTGPAVGTSGDPNYLYEIIAAGTTCQLKGIGSIKGDKGDKGDKGPAGANGVGVPSGGTAGQVLVKASDTDYDGTWVDSSELTDEIDAELAALNPDVHSDAYSWTLGRNYNSAGSLGSQAGFAITGYFDVKPGTLFVNRSVPVDGDGKNTQVFIHQFSGSTWLRRNGLMNEPKYVAVDDDANRVRIAFGYPSDQGVTITQQMIDDNFAIRIVKKVPEEASDVGAVAANQGSANAGKFLVVGSDGTVTPTAMSAWQGGNYGS